MNVQEKQAVVDELASKLQGAEAFYLTDFTGLNVKNATELRSQLRNAGVEYLVVKNTLVKRALTQLELPDIAEFFVGPTAVAFTADPVAAAKVLDDFARAHDNRPAFKAGIVEQRAVTPEEIGRLAKLPPREQLLALLAGAFQAPLAQLLFALQAKLSEFSGLLEALRTEREQG